MLKKLFNQPRDDIYLDEILVQKYFILISVILCLEEKLRCLLGMELKLILKS